MFNISSFDDMLFPLSNRNTQTRNAVIQERRFVLMGVYELFISVHRLATTATVSFSLCSWTDGPIISLYTTFLSSVIGRNR
jgi:hypothetical protein